MCVSAIILFLMSWVAAGWTGNLVADSIERVQVTSPDQRIVMEVWIAQSDDLTWGAQFRVSFAGREVVGPSPLGVEWVGGGQIGSNCQIVSAENRTVCDEFVQVSGKRRQVLVEAHEAVISFRELASPHRIWELALRASDDGVAWRYQFPVQPGWEMLEIAHERTAFRVRPDAQAFALPLKGFTTSYEARYQPRLAKDLPGDWLLALPLLLENPDGTWLALTEANVHEYAGTYLGIGEGAALTTRLAPRKDDPGVALRHPLPHRSP